MPTYERSDCRTGYSFEMTVNGVVLRFNLVTLAWIWTKVRYRLSLRVFEARVRWREGQAKKPWVAPRSDTPILPWQPLAAFPGNTATMPWATASLPSDEEVVAANELIAHRFKLLSSETISVVKEDDAQRASIAALAGELPPEAIARYRPIDWHGDFYRGYRWSPDTLYLDVKVGPFPGIDIKIPRELSRFQHVGALASGDHQAGAKEFLLQALDWIAANPVRRGVNWACTMDVALRAVNWIWALRLFEPVISNYPEALRTITGSLWEHGNHIENNLEYYEDCTGNHYLSDIAGLIYIGAACQDFAQSDRWLLFGLQELVSEMEREVLCDGAAHEASTHYHRLVAELFLSCAALAERVPAQRRERLLHVDRRAHRVRPPLRDPTTGQLNLTETGPMLPAAFYGSLSRMCELTARLTKPNGLVPQIGDNDSARAHKLPGAQTDETRDHAHIFATAGALLDRPDLRELGTKACTEAEMIAGDLCGRITTPTATPTQPSARLFNDIGWGVMRNETAWLAVSCGTNGQARRGGHGHNDKNSFELNVWGLDFIVDGGCPAYSSDPATRNRYRGTLAHNTVGIAGVEQDRWEPGLNGLFKLVERSSPRLEMTGDRQFVGSHSGFGPIHRRTFNLGNEGLEIDDYLDDMRERWINFNLDPAVAVHALSHVGDTVEADLRHRTGKSLLLTVAGVGAAEVGPGTFGVGFGQPQANLALRMRLTRIETQTRIHWVA